MPSPLGGAAALVTGGSSGIGAATVDLLRGEGARVAVLDLQEPGRPGPTWVRCDVADEAQVVAAVAEVETSLGGLDVAVLCAGVGGFSALVDMPAAEWDRVITVNLRGTFLCLREVARAMRSGGRGGSVVAVTSVSGFLADRMMAHYSASKAAVAELVRVAARELGPGGIRVNAVAPGTTDTPMFAATERLPGYRERVARRSALGAVGSPEGVARAIVSLLQLEWVTGQILCADGGVSLWSPIDPVESLEDP
ncbi:MAG TPA: SDR family oxidoreductase [Acidimicrobiales bacterium]|nr:SDR family oxidoreductase [Acidimicrobiales bacterium]